MVNAKRLMSVVLVLAMIVTMASFPVSAASFVVAPVTVTPIRSTTADGTKTMELTVDGNTSTGFATSGYLGSVALASSANYVVFDLGRVTTVDTVKLNWGASSPWGYTSADTFKIWVSADDVTYTEVKSYSGIIKDKNTHNGEVEILGGSDDNLRTAVTAKGLNAENTRYIKVEILGWKDRCILTEIEVKEAIPAIEYTIKYVDANGNSIKEASTGAGLEGDQIDVEAPHVSGYLAVGTTTKSITLAKDAVNEVEFTYIPFEKMTSFPDNITVLATVDSYAGVETSSRPISNILDGDPNTVAATGWTKTPNMNIVVDLGKVYDLDNIVLNWATNTSTGMNWGVAGGAHRANRYTVYVSLDGETYETLYTYDDTTRLDAKDTIDANNAETALVGRYIKIVANRTFAEGRIALRDISVYAYTATDRVVSAPELQYYATGSTSVDFPITVTTVDSVSPESYFAAANWALENCTIDSVTVEDVSNPASIYSTWDIHVKAIPDTTKDYFAMELDLPDSYAFDDKLSFHREASDLLFNSAIADGDNAIILTKNNLTLVYDANGSLTTTTVDRTIGVYIDVQKVLESGLPYKGYNDLAIEVTEVLSNGDRIKYDFEDFVRVGDRYYGSILVNKAGVDRLQATVVLYGVHADGSKVELEKRVIYSDMLEFIKQVPAVQTEAQKNKDWTIPVDILDQLYDQVHPFDLPAISEAEWDFYEQVLIARGWNAATAKAEIERHKTEIATRQALASEPGWVAPDYPDSIMITNSRYKVNTNEYEANPIINVSTYNWNVLKDLHVESFSLRGPIVLPSATQLNQVENVIEDAYITFRNGIDYDQTNFLDATNFAIRVKLIGSSGEYKDVNLLKGYNAVRRALNDDQVSPVMFRVDWYNWAKNPFTGGVITVKLTEDWVDNYGAFNLASYSMTGYSYTNDNDPTLTLVQDKFCIKEPMTREVSVIFEGAQHLYDTYVIVSTNKLPSELPETIGTYYDAE